MRLRTTKSASNWLAGIRETVRRGLRDRTGNIAMTFALLTVPTVIGIGVGVDYVRAYNTQSRMQSDLDAALIAAVKEVDTLTEDAIKEKMATWFAAQTELETVDYTIPESGITVSKDKRTITAIATATVPTTLMGLANINSIKVSARTSVAGPATSFMNVYMVLDKSPSMLLAATSADQTSMRSKIGCEFACHSTDDPVTYGGKTYSTYYAFASAMGIKLRTDVATAAAEEVLDMIETSNSSNSHIKVGLYKLGATATEVLAPTASISLARTRLTTASYGLTSATSESATYFDKSFAALNTIVGTAGDGSSASKPLKLVLLLTDGVQSERNWVLWWNKPTYDVLNWKSNQTDSVKQQIWKVITPLNPSWCSTLKKNGVTMGVLYTEYLPITSDWGYNATVGQTMATSKFSSVWSGTMRSTVSSSTTRRDYIPYALEDCASSNDLFLSAASESEIESGLSTLFSQYLGSVRLTQ